MDDQQQAVELLTAVASHAEQSGYAFGGVIRRCAQVVAGLTVDTTTEDGCPRCGGPVERKPRGRPPVYCSDACRHAAGQERKRDEIGPC